MPRSVQLAAVDASIHTMSIYSTNTLLHLSSTRGSMPAASPRCGAGVAVVRRAAALLAEPRCEGREREAPKGLCLAGAHLRRPHACQCGRGLAVRAKEITWNHGSIEQVGSSSRRSIAAPAMARGYTPATPPRRPGPARCASNSRWPRAPCLAAWAALL